MVLRPYIGITDFTSFEQVQAMLKIFQMHRTYRSKRLLHVGVMMSYKTLHGLDTKWSKAFPAKEHIASIFASKNVYNCLHYADYDRCDPEVWRSLARAITFGGTNIHAIQLDMPWPDPGQVAHGVHTSRKKVEVILQVGEKALDAAGNDRDLVVRKLEDYEGIIHRVLLDKSGGKGKGMDAPFLLPFAQAIQERFPGIGLVAAGGLGPGKVDLVGPLAKEFPDISIDAQGKLRPSGNSLDPVDWSLAGAYFLEALQYLK